jgi:hypothetical protein
LNVNDENSRIQIQDPDPNPDPLIRGMDPRIRIHPKISWIRNTAKYIPKLQSWGSAQQEGFPAYVVQDGFISLKVPEKQYIVLMFLY